ncbi:Zn(2)-C6 fungal-type domain-containing protein [Fusarium sp. LHS14.1]|nr:Zn(2)-C6 fungal-type domain-containing protein [Fusarium sp. LHS14.1]
MSFLDRHKDQQLLEPFKPPFRRKFKPKAKTGCHTCRIRRVKCDEARPACRRCMSTDRVCDGYPSVFRVLTFGDHQSSASAPTPSSQPTLSLYQPKSSIVTADQVDKLALYFHRKRRVNVCYRNEARAILANLSDPTIRHALDSLIALHDGFETTRHTAVIGPNGPFITQHSLDAYNVAVSSLASRLKEEPNRTSAQVALVCCQMFVSIEVMMGDYTTAFQHFLLGLRIMYQYRNRPSVSDSGRVVPCGNLSLPHLDEFAIKLFASGYPGPKHLCSCERGDSSSATNNIDPILCDQARSDLSVLSVEVLEFLNWVTGLRSQYQVAELKATRTQILGRLQSWEETYSETANEIIERTTSKRVRFGAAFSLLLHSVLKIVVDLAIGASTDDVRALGEQVTTIKATAHMATEIGKVV